MNVYQISLFNRLSVAVTVFSLIWLVPWYFMAMQSVRITEKVTLTNLQTLELPQLEAFIVRSVATVHEDWFRLIATNTLLWGVIILALVAYLVRLEKFRSALIASWVLLLVTVFAQPHVKMTDAYWTYQTGQPYKKVRTVIDVSSTSMFDELQEKYEINSDGGVSEDELAKDGDRQWPTLDDLVAKLFHGTSIFSVMGYVYLLGAAVMTVVALKRNGRGRPKAA